MTQLFEKYKKKTLLAHFGPISSIFWLSIIFLKALFLRFFYSDQVSLCQVSKKLKKGFQAIPASDRCMHRKKIYRTLPPRVGSPKMFGLWELYLEMQRITLLVLVAFGQLESSRGISLAFNMLPFMNNLGYFCSSNVVYNCLECFLTLHSQQWYIFFLQEKTVLPNNVVGGLM